MDYLKVRWIHRNAKYPVLLLSELDTDRHEVRKVEVFADGRMTLADGGLSTGDTVLSVAPIPPSQEIAADPQFEILDIESSEFERVWTDAMALNPRC